MTKRGAPPAEKSAYVRDLEAALARYLAAESPQEKRAIEREVAAIIGTQRGLNAWKAHAATVSHGTSRDPRCPRRKAKRERWRRDFRGEFDHKRAQVHEDEDE